MRIEKALIVFDNKDPARKSSRPYHYYATATDINMLTEFDFVCMIKRNDNEDSFAMNVLKNRSEKPAKNIQIDPKSSIHTSMVKDFDTLSYRKSNMNFEGTYTERAVKAIMDSMYISIEENKGDIEGLVNKIRGS